MMVISYKKKRRDANIIKNKKNGETQILLKINRRKTNKKEINIITFYFYTTSFVLLSLSIRDEALFLLLF